MRERIYIIGPYCPKDCSLHDASRVAQHNVDNAIEAGNKLIEQGNYVFVPHLSHYIHTHHSCKKDYGLWWIEEDLTFLDHWATAVYLLNGWTNSDGSLKEFKRATKLGLKIMGDENKELTKNEKYMLDELKGKGLRCPKCNKKAVRYIPYKIENTHTLDVIYPRKILKCDRYYCFNCKSSSKDTKFLDEYADMLNRSERYVAELCRELTLSGIVCAKATEILRDYDAKWGRKDVASASVYLSSILCGERRTQLEVSKMANVSESAIRKNYKDIAKKLDIGIIL